MSHASRLPGNAQPRELMAYWSFGWHSRVISWTHLPGMLVFDRTCPVTISCDRKPLNLSDLAVRVLPPSPRINGMLVIQMAL
jgi:hypothetical protein